MALQEKKSSPTDIPVIHDGDEFVAGVVDPDVVLAPDGSTILEAEVVVEEPNEPFDPEFDLPGTPIDEPEPTADGPSAAEGVLTREDRQKALTEVYGEATKQLRNNHQQEFDALRVKLSADRGIDWKPRESKQDKKLREIREAIAADPALGKALGL